MKTKKSYIKPTMDIVDADIQTHLLSGSGDNPYWQEGWEGPKPTEECANPYWCGN